MLEHFNISIDRLIDHYNIGVGFNTNFLITSQIVNSTKLLDFPCRINAVAMGICQKGELWLNVNSKKWKIIKNTCFISIPENVIGIEKLTADFEGYVIVISMSYIKDINIDIAKVLPYYIFVRTNPCFYMDEEDTTDVIRFFDVAENSIKNNKNNQWKSEIVRGVISALIYKVCGTLEQYGQEIEMPKTKSKEYYFFKFIELCSQHYQNHHDIGYYADIICLTPKYLSIIVKEMSGLSAAEWIDEYIINDAKIQLKYSDRNVQQISDSLNFLNQSLFGRYFKQHVGMSPSLYKMNYASPKNKEM